MSKTKDVVIDQLNAEPRLTERMDIGHYFIYLSKFLSHGDVLKVEEDEDGYRTFRFYGDNWSHLLHEYKEKESQIIYY